MMILLYCFFKYLFYYMIHSFIQSVCFIKRLQVACDWIGVYQAT